MKKQLQQQISDAEISERVRLSASLNPHDITSVVGPLTGCIAADFGRESGVSAYAAVELFDSIFSAFGGPHLRQYVSPLHAWNAALLHWSGVVAGEVFSLPCPNITPCPACFLIVLSNLDPRQTNRT